MTFNKNQENNTNKPENSKKLESIIKKMGKKINFHVDGCSDGKTNVGLDFYTTQFIYSKTTPPAPPPPEPTVIEKILIGINEIKEVQKIQGEEIKKINTKVDKIDERLTKLENKVDKIDERLTKLENKVENVIILNNLKLQ
ncbi:MAG: hypothetical protein LBF02_01395 [Mycoplasmataceae bacterium]|jgi:tetrahydromethanopterin S-methyltransferase subunit G|nr:hypothetical protein [Mycoplasmataceae bacterium]